MCGIVGIVNYKKDIKEQEKLISEMSNTLEKRGPDENRLLYGASRKFGP